MAKKIDHYDIVTLNIVTHHLVPLLLALRGQDRGADSAWALGLHIIVIFEFVLSEQIGSDFFLLIRNSFPRLPCSWQQSKLGNIIKKRWRRRKRYVPSPSFLSSSSARLPSLRLLPLFSSPPKRPPALLSGNDKRSLVHFFFLTPESH